MPEEEKTKYKAAVVGPKDVVAGLKALGLEVFHASGGEEAVEHIKNIKQSQEHAVVLIPESISEQIPADEFAELSEGNLPAIVSIPGIEGATGNGNRRIKELSEKALGTSVI